MGLHVCILHDYHSVRIDLSWFGSLSPATPDSLYHMRLLHVALISYLVLVIQCWDPERRDSSNSQRNIKEWLRSRRYPIPKNEDMGSSQITSSVDSVAKNDNLSSNSSSSKILLSNRALFATNRDKREELLQSGRGRFSIPKFQFGRGGIPLGGGGRGGRNLGGSTHSPPSPLSSADTTPSEGQEKRQRQRQEKRGEETIPSKDTTPFSGKSSPPNSNGVSPNGSRFSSYFPPKSPRLPPVPSRDTQLGSETVDRRRWARPPRPPPPLAVLPPPVYSYSIVGGAFEPQRAEPIILPPANNLNRYNGGFDSYGNLRVPPTKWVPLEEVQSHWTPLVRLQRIPGTESDEVQKESSTTTTPSPIAESVEDEPQSSYENASPSWEPVVEKSRVTYKKNKNPTKFKQQTKSITPIVNGNYQFVPINGNPRVVHHEQGKSFVTELTLDEPKNLYKKKRIPVIAAVPPTDDPAVVMYDEDTSLNTELLDDAFESTYQVKKIPTVAPLPTRNDLRSIYEQEEDISYDGELIQEETKSNYKKKKTPIFTKFASAPNRLKEKYKIRNISAVAPVRKDKPRKTSKSFDEYETGVAMSQHVERRIKNHPKYIYAVKNADDSWEDLHREIFD